MGRLVAFLLAAEAIVTGLSVMSRRFVVAVVQPL